MKVSLIFMLLILASCSNGKQHTDQQTYQQYKKTLEEKEKENPVSFLDVSGGNRKNLIGQTVIRGVISNHATIVSYKNIRIKTLCYRDNKRVEEHEDVISDIVPPNKSLNFKTRYRLPKGTDSVSLSVMNAVVADSK